MTQRARLADTSEDFKKYDINKHTIATWEDGIRTNPNTKGTYEWWYFDANLNDGSQLVITFFAKSAVNPGSELEPSIDIEHTQADGSKISDHLEFTPAEFSAAKDDCNVKIGQNYFRGNLKHYQIGVFSPKITVELEFDNVTPAWRRNVCIFFGDHDENNFGWLPATPRGKVTAKVTIASKEQTLTGDCYHDHNWGDVALMKVMHHWYWGRANIGDYTVISSYMTAEKKYGYQKLPIFFLAKKDQVLADNPKYMTYSEQDKQIDEQTKKPFHNQIIYDYNDGKHHYKISYLREKTISRISFIDQISGIKKLLAKLAGFDGAYLRFSGKIKLEVFDDDQVIETQSSQGLWEEMYFGKTLDV
ncbi:hypothetical protein OZX56_01475 [Lactobacillus sp. ESL0684]|uniref:lipocalin-like domain-containing protein n=1 Tax=Lactobacillus sp. ESL0684 TaxID=2983213 RepID=UPI0023F7D791|nr:lipocalin-like domain-containing protein [Lactobacillus sp. ESL0684]WEV43927.1 hypothetical protein OZX56_01475 [Lactobacillus sp. ESL0684]